MLNLCCSKPPSLWSWLWQCPGDTASGAGPYCPCRMWKWMRSAGSGNGTPRQERGSYATHRNTAARWEGQGCPLLSSHRVGVVMAQKPFKLASGWQVNRGAQIFSFFDLGWAARPRGDQKAPWNPGDRDRAPSVIALWPEEQDDRAPGLSLQVAPAFQQGKAMGVLAGHKGWLAGTVCTGPCGWASDSPPLIGLTSSTPQLSPHGQ